MARGSQAPPGDLVYLSPRKLYGCAAQLRIETAARRPDLDFEGSAEARLGLPPVAEVSARGSARGSRIDPGWEEHLLHRHLELVVEGLGALPSLEHSETVREGEWFRFHRDLKFGVGHADAEPSIRALIVVDGAEQEMRTAGAVVPGLLMNGSVAHATEELRTAAGNRSGSGTDELFIWLEKMRLASEEEPETPSRSLRSANGAAPRSAETALEMYGAFARDGRMQSHMAEPLMRQAPCEGIGQASFVAVGEERVLVMGSPLYVRICPLEEREERRPGIFSRLRSSR